jgi:magnesium-transporting ATPase (P-type)
MSLDYGYAPSNKTNTEGLMNEYDVPSESIQPTRVPKSRRWGIAILVWIIVVIIFNVGFAGWYISQVVDNAILVSVTANNGTIPTSTGAHSTGSAYYDAVVNLVFSTVLLIFSVSAIAIAVFGIFSVLGLRGEPKPRNWNLTIVFLTLLLILFGFNCGIRVAELSLNLISALIGIVFSMVIYGVLFVFVGCRLRHLREELIVHNIFI